MTKSSEGFILLDCAMSPILVNSAAAKILAYPKKPETLENLSSYLNKQDTHDTFFEAAPHRVASAIDSQ